MDDLQIPLVNYDAVADAVHRSIADKNVLRWKAESENASARLELAQMNQRMAILLSQHEPLHTLNIDRTHFRLCVDYIQKGNMKYLMDAVEKNQKKSSQQV